MKIYTNNLKVYSMIISMLNNIMILHSQIIILYKNYIKNLGLIVRQYVNMNKKINKIIKN